MTSPQEFNYKTYHSTKLPSVIMIHGFRGTHHGLDLIAKELTDYHVIVPDLPGFGEGEPLAGEHDLKNYVNWLHSFITELHLTKPPVLLGHSFGSIIASSYAAHFPETIVQLILVNPIGAPALEGPKAFLTQLAVFYYWLGRKLPTKLAHTWLSAKPIVMIMSMSMAKTHNRKTRAYIHNQHLQHFSSFATPQVVSEAFRTSVTNTVRDHATTITTPTLLIAGEKDDITPLHKQQELVKLFPDATLKVIRGVGHLTHYETPVEVAELVKEFLNSQ